MAKYRLGDICEIVSGSTPKTSVEEYWDGEIKWITPAELTDDSYIITDSARKITKLGVQKTGLSSFPKGTVILSSRAPIGKVAIAGCEMYCNQGFKNLICSDKINNKYLYWFLKGNTAYLNSLGRGATLKEISKQIVSAIEINVPSKEEQQKTVDTLEKINDIISLRKREINQLDNLVKARFVEMFGEEYKKVTADEVCTAIIDCPHSTPKYDETELKYPAIRTSEIQNGTINWASMKYVGPIEYEKRIKRLRPIAGDIVYAREGTYGDCVILPSNAEFCLGQRTMLFRPDERICTSVYLHAVLRSEKVKRQADESNAGSTVPHVNVADAKKFYFALPPLELQEQFSAFVAQVDKSKVAVQKALDEAQLLFDSLMQEYFR